jgi:hypothetical protein
MRFFREPWAAAQGSQTEILAEQRLFSYRWIGGSPERLTPSLETYLGRHCCVCGVSSLRPRSRWP